MVQYPSSHLHFFSSLYLEPHSSLKWYNKSARVFLFEQLLFSKVDFGASDFEAAVGLQVEAAGKMKVATRVLDHRTIQNCFA